MADLSQGGMVPGNVGLAGAQLPQGVVNPAGNVNLTTLPLPAGVIRPVAYVPPVTAPTPLNGPTYAHSAIGDIMAAAARGFGSTSLTNLGQAAQYFGATQAGAGLRNAGAAVLNAVPWLRPDQESAHSGLTNTLANAAEGLTSFAPEVAAGAGLAGLTALTGGADLPVIGGALAAGASALPAAVVMAGQSGTEAYERYRQAGLTPEQSQGFANEQAALGGATGLLGGAVAGKVLHGALSPVGKLFGQNAESAAADALTGLTGARGALGTAVRQIPTAVLEGSALGAVQNAGAQEINNQAGVDQGSVLQAALQGAGVGAAMGGMGAGASYFGLRGQTRRAQAAADALSSADTAVATRQQIADNYAKALSKVNPSAAEAFAANAKTAIDNNMPFAPTADMFTHGQVQAPSPEEIQAAPVQPPVLGLPAPQGAPMVADTAGRVMPNGGGLIFPDGSATNDSSMMGAWQEAWAKHDAAQNVAPSNALPAPADVPRLPNQGNIVTPDGTVIPRGTAFNFPDGSSTTDVMAAHAYVDSLPEKQQPAAWAALAGVDTPPAVPDSDAAKQHAQDVQDLHGQVKDALTAAGLTPAAPLSRADFSKLPGNETLKGQSLAKAYKAYVAAPDTQEGLMHQDADALQAHEEAQAAPGPFPFPQASDVRANNPLVDEPRTPVPEPEQPSQLVQKLAAAMQQKQVDDAYAAHQAMQENEKNIDFTRMQGDLEAQQADAGTTPEGGSLVSKSPATIAADAKAVASDGGVNLRAQDLALLNKKLGAAGINDAKNHDEQIDTLQKAVDAIPDTKANTNYATTMRSLLDKWKADAGRPAGDTERPLNEPMDENRPTNPLPDQEPLSEATADAKAQADQVSQVVSEQPKAAEGTQTVSPLERMASNLTEPKPGEGSQPLGAEEALAEHANISASSQDRAAETLARLNKAIRELKKQGNLSPDDALRLEEMQDNAAELRPSVKNGTSHAGLDQIIKNTDRLTGTKSNLLAHIEQNPAKIRDSAARSFSLMLPGVRSGKVAPVMDHIVQNGSSTAAKVLASKLSKLLGGTKFKFSMPGEDGQRANMDGAYNPNTDTVHVWPGGEKEATVLHEGVHAAIYKAMVNFLPKTVRSAFSDEPTQNFGRAPTSQAEKAQQIAARQINDVYQAVLDRIPMGATIPYGMHDVHEFAAESLANPEFQKYLDGIKADAPRTSMWGKFVDAVRRLLGLSADQRSFAEQALTAGNRMLDAMKDAKEFVSSDAGAARVTDKVVAHYAQAADQMERDPSAPSRMFRVPIKAFKVGIQIVTQDFMRHFVSDVPEYRATGFLSGFDQFLGARDMTRTVASRVGEPFQEIATRLGRTLDMAAKQGKYTRAQLEEKMMRIAGEGVRFNFNPFEPIGPQAQHRGLAGETRAYAEQIHREFTQLHPDLQKAMRDGADANQNLLSQMTSVVARMRMEAMSGEVGRLTAQVDRLKSQNKPTGDVEAHIKTLQDFVAKHIDRLDIMAHDPAKLDTHLREAFKDARGLVPNSDMQAAMGELEKIYTAQYGTPYFSLGRDGDYYVNVGVKNNGAIPADALARVQQAMEGTSHVIGDLRGNDHIFLRTDSAEQARALYSKLSTALGEHFEPKNGNEAGRLPDNSLQQVKGVSIALRQLESSVRDELTGRGVNAEQADEVMRMLTRTMLNMLPETAARSAKMQRKGVPGYSAKFVQSFSKRAIGGQQEMGQLYTNRTRTAGLEAMQAAVRQMNQNPTQRSMGLADRAQAVLDENKTRWANTTTKMDNTILNIINSLGRTYFLAFSPGILIRTMAQPWHRGIPILAARYGAVRSAREMGNATATAIKVISASIRAASQEGLESALNTGIRFDQIKGLDPETIRYLKAGDDQGLFHLGNAHELANAAAGQSAKLNHAQRALALFVQYAEITNRITTGLAAFRMEHGASKIADPEARFQSAAAWANKAVNNAMDNMDQENTARAIGKFGWAGKATPLMSAFMNYELQATQQVMRTVHDGLYANDPQRKQEARKELAGLIATTTVISGLRGLPFMGAAAGLYNTLMQYLDPDNPHDVRDSMQQWLDSTLGHGAGDFMARGIGSQLGVDMSSYGLDNILPGSEFLAARGNMQERFQQQSAGMSGAAISILGNFSKAADQMAEGQYVKAVESTLPPFLRNLYKVGEMTGAIGPGGYTDTHGNVMPGMKPDAVADVAQGLGFRTFDKAEMDEARLSLDQNQKLLQARRAALSTQLYQSFMQGEGNPGDVMQKIMAYNQENPYQPITDVGQELRQRVLQNAIGGMYGLGTPMSAREGLVARQQVGFGMQGMVPSNGQ